MTTRLAKQQHSTLFLNILNISLPLMLKFLISRFVEDVNTRQRLSISFFSSTLIQSFRSQRKKNWPTFDELNKME